MINSMITFFVGCVTFVLMMLIKIPIKRYTREVAKDFSQYRHFNIIVLGLTFLVALICYCFVLVWIGESHFKLCCALKGAAVAVAIYAVYEQWFGEDELEKR